MRVSVPRPCHIILIILDFLFGWVVGQQHEWHKSTAINIKHYHTIIQSVIFINDIDNEIESFINLFSDDTSLYVKVEHPNTAATLLQSDIQKISFWQKRG
jgi:hypothetical protein